MDFSKEKIVNYFLYDTQVENLFAAEYMLDAPGDYVKVYLLALVHAQMNDPVDQAFLAKHLKLSVSQVNSAWDYWESKGVIRKLAKGSDGSSFEVRFVNLKEAVFGSCAVSYGPKADYQPIPQLDDKELSDLYKEVEQVCGRLLDAREPEAIASWITDYGMDPGVILAGYRYCVEKGRSSRYRYVEKILLDWREKQLTSTELVEAYLLDTDKQYELYRQIFGKLGFRRNPTEPEKKTMQKWFSEMNFSPEEVFAAIEKTTGISNPNIKYIDSILTSKFSEKKQEEGEKKYAKIQEIYAKTREANEKKYALVKKEIYSKIPRLEEIGSEAKDCGYRIVKAMLSQNVSELTALEARQKSLENEKFKLLADFGYGENALEPIYSCRKCKDTGFTEDGSYCSCYAEKLNSIG